MSKAQVKRWRKANPDKVRAAQQRTNARPERKERHRVNDRNWAIANHHKRLLMKAKIRAKQSHVAFDLEPSDIVIPNFCPVLGIPIGRQPGTWNDNSATIERLDSKGGYTKDNIIVCSFKANRIKSNATVAELRAIADFFQAAGAP